MMRTLPLQEIETTTYDAVGNLSTKTDFNGKMMAATLSR
jgi:YD repeat-containing protein